MQITLRPDEKVVREFSIGARLFWALVIFGGLLAVIIPIFLLTALRLLAIDLPVGGSIVIWLVGLSMGLALVLYALYFRASRSYVITDQRLISTNGWLSRETVSADYEQITDLRVVQDVFERLLLGTGLVAVNTAGADIEELHLERVTQPYQLSNQIRQLCEARLQATGRNTVAPPPAIRDGPRPVTARSNQ